LSGLTEAHRFDTYLGLPSIIGKSKIQSFNSIKESVQKRLNNWLVKFLSQVGKEILLKAVVQAILTYCMSVFLLPIVVQRIKSIDTEFLVGTYVKRDQNLLDELEKLGRSKSVWGVFGFRILLCSTKPS
jgi:hypothetical protein